jgi:hypothetical protein
MLVFFSRPDKLNRLTVIPGWVKIKIEPITELPESMLESIYTYKCLFHNIFVLRANQSTFISFFLVDSLTTSLSPLKPFPLPPTNEPTIEVMEFEGMSEKDVHPYTTFLNHLYVYPQSLSFDTQKTFTRARNIACVVELRDSDSEGALPLCVSVYSICVSENRNEVA